MRGRTRALGGKSASSVPRVKPFRAVQRTIMDQIQPTAAPEPSSPWQVLLPVEILAEVFCYLSPGQLQHVRLTCHRWNQVVCNTPTLMRQFVLWFDDRSVLFNDDREEQSMLAANVTGRYSMAHVDLGLRGSGVVSPLWAKIGGSIESLTLEVWYIDPLIDILRMTPNLKCLKIRTSKGFDDFPHGEFRSVRSVDFKLEQLIELHFGGEYVELFCQICPNLQVLIQKVNFKPYETNIMPLIRATEATLEKLSLNNCYLSQDSFRELCSLDGLRLKELMVDWQDPWSYPESYMAFISKHPTLEHLRLEPLTRSGADHIHHDCNPQMWAKIKEKLPKLKSLHLKIQESHSADLPVFLSEMPQLECLGIEICNRLDIHLLHLSSVTNHNLTRLELRSVNLNAEDLAVFFANSPNIRHLILTNFVSDDAFRSISGLKQLELLEEGVYDIRQPDFVFNALKTFKKGSFYSTSTKDIVTVIPNVEHWSTANFYHQPTDDDILILVQGLKRLRNLHLTTSHCDITERAFDHIIEHGHALEQLRITLDTRDFPTLPEKLAQLRRKAVRVRVVDDPHDERERRNPEME